MTQTDRFVVTVESVARESATSSNLEPRLDADGTPVIDDLGVIVLDPVDVVASWDRYDLKVDHRDPKTANSDPATATYHRSVTVAEGDGMVELEAAARVVVDEIRAAIETERAAAEITGGFAAGAGDVLSL